MKSIIKSKKTPDKPFPKLMTNAIGTIVLFSYYRIGVIIGIDGNSIGTIGEYRTDWNMPSFKDFEGEVTLSND